MANPCQGGKPFSSRNEVDLGPAAGSSVFVCEQIRILEGRRLGRGELQELEKNVTVQVPPQEEPDRRIFPTKMSFSETFHLYMKYLL
jgi:hypothetical protein